VFGKRVKGLPASSILCNDYPRLIVCVQLASYLHCDVIADLNASLKGVESQQDLRAATNRI
jgi:hypothetical protein